MLETALNCVEFSWASSPALTELEQVVMDWTADLYGLPDCFKFSSKGLGGGCFQGTARHGFEINNISLIKLISKYKFKKIVYVLIRSKGTKRGPKNYGPS